jgi:hypothetical protein
MKTHVDEFVVIDRRKEVNVWSDSDGYVWMTVEDRDDRATVALNPAQVDRLIALLQKAARAAGK